MNYERANKIRVGLGLEPLPVPSESPSILQKIENVGKAVVRVTSAAMSEKQVLVSPEEQGRRMAICAGIDGLQPRCEFFTGTTCRKCGCVAKFKTKLATETCPIGKW